MSVMEAATESLSLTAREEKFLLPPIKKPKRHYHHPFNYRLIQPEPGVVIATDGVRVHIVQKPDRVACEVDDSEKARGLLSILRERYFPKQSDPFFFLSPEYYGDLFNWSDLFKKQHYKGVKFRFGIEEGELLLRIWHMIDTGPIEGRIVFEGVLVGNPVETFMRSINPKYVAEALQGFRGLYAPTKRPMLLFHLTHDGLFMQTPDQHYMAFILRLREENER